MLLSSQKIVQVWHLWDVSTNDGRATQKLLSQTTAFELGSHQCARVCSACICSCFAYFHPSAANMIQQSSEGIQQPSEDIQQPLEGIQLLSTESLSKAVRSNCGAYDNAIYCLYCKMLRCLVDFSTRSIRLELMKPRIQENDFIKVQGTQKGLRIENARFKTRVRLNKHVRRSNTPSGGIVCTYLNIDQ